MLTFLYLNDKNLQEKSDHYVLICIGEWINASTEVQTQRKQENHILFALSV